MNRIFQKFLQSGINLFSMGAKCREDNTHDMDMNPDAETTNPEWKVYFDGNFWEPSGKGHAETEIRLDRQFEWAGHHWIIPAAYSCNKGLILDFCMCTKFNDDLAILTILQTENWHENRMPPILYKSVFRLRHHKKQIWVCITGPKSAKTASWGANYVPFSAKLQTK